MLAYISFFVKLCQVSFILYVLAALIKNSWNQLILELNKWWELGKLAEEPAYIHISGSI